MWCKFAVSIYGVREVLVQINVCLLLQDRPPSHTSSFKCVLLQRDQNGVLRCTGSADRMSFSVSHSPGRWQISFPSHISVLASSKWALGTISVRWQTVCSPRNFSLPPLLLLESCLPWFSPWLDVPDMAECRYSLPGERRPCLHCLEHAVYFFHGGDPILHHSVWLWTYLLSIPTAAPQLCLSHTRHLDESWDLADFTHCLILRTSDEAWPRAGAQWTSVIEWINACQVLDRY